MMMGESVVGLGCDILEVGRIQALVEKSQDGFLKRVLTEPELEQFRLRSHASPERGLLFLATRFCAKEAFAKAMGTGIGKQFSFQDLSVLNEDSGAPRLVYSERLNNWLKEKQVGARISISDERNYVMSTVILYLNTIY